MLKCVLSLCLYSRVFVFIITKNKRGSHRASRVEIAKDKSSIFSLSDRWYTQQRTKEYNWAASRDATNKTMSHSSRPKSCLKFFSYAITEWCSSKFYLQFTLTFHFFDLLFHIHSVPCSFQLCGLGNQKTLVFKNDYVVFLASTGRSRVGNTFRIASFPRRFHSY